MLDGLLHLFFILGRGVWWGVGYNMQHAPIHRESQVRVLNFNYHQDLNKKCDHGIPLT